MYHVRVDFVELRQEPPSNALRMKAWSAVEPRLQTI